LTIKFESLLVEFWNDILEVLLFARLRRAHLVVGFCWNSKIFPELRTSYSLALV